VRSVFEISDHEFYAGVVAEIGVSHEQRDGAGDGKGVMAPVEKHIGLRAHGRVRRTIRRQLTRVRLGDLRSLVSGYSSTVTQSCSGSRHQHPTDYSA
jgi:hypothetical protein